jgi:molybdopterin/thiamine biosynthesis adenylyltransferase
LLEKQTAFIMGVGGLGSVVMIALLRLGVKKIIIVDYDVVDNHNMNRQLMYSVKDIGQKKVDCAIKNAEFHNVGNTIIEGFHGNALLNWTKMIEFVKESDVVFNCIDHGDKYDVAVTALCLKLKKPLIMGGTFATSMTVDYFGVEGGPCFLCTNDEAAR